ncbi:MAG TPA: hypothetical protein VGI81_06930 [Tepidisphaeraceae bacterium]|jgi:cation transport ATPase
MRGSFPIRYTRRAPIASEPPAGLPSSWRRTERRQFGSDLLAGISIVTSVLLGEYLAGALVVLMLSGGESLESFAVRSASSVLRALARRMPSVAHRKADSQVVDVPLTDVAIGDMLIVFPHEICPVDGVVTEGHGVMDESYLTGEPFRMSKTAGSDVLSGAINGETALTIRATKLAVDSRYAKIMQVMRASEQDRPRLRRLGDQIGADGMYAATLRFRDEPRREGVAFVHHLRPKHRFARLMLVSGDRESEVRYLAEQVGITEVYAGNSIRCEKAGAGSAALRLCIFPPEDASNVRSVGAFDQ